LKNGTDFFNGVQVGVEILHRKFAMKTAINLKVAEVKKV
jgi:hypothetical protein